MANTDNNNKFSNNVTTRNLLSNLYTLNGTEAGIFDV